MHRFALPALLLSTLAACGSGVGSEEDAKKAYDGLDASVDKAITLGFDGFNAASSANIDPQSVAGDETGTMTVTGQVDQGASTNKTMSLDVELVDYSDDALVTYDTEGALAALDMKLSKVPDGTLDGTLVGEFTMTGDLGGIVTLNIAFAGDLQANANDPAIVERVPGSTHVTGSATSDYGTYAIDFIR